MAKPEVSIGLGLAVGTLVIALHMNATPSMGDVQTLDADNPDVEKAEKTATWFSAGAVAFTSLVARDPMIFIIGGSIVVGMALWTRYANHQNPITGLFTGPGDPAGSANTVQGPAPQETEPYTMFEDQFVR